MAGEIVIKNGEGKWLQFTITRNNQVIDLSTALFQFGVKKNIDDASYVLEKVDADFDKTNASVGVVKINILASETSVDLLPAGRYSSELEIIITADADVDKSVLIPFTVQQSLIPN